MAYLNPNLFRAQLFEDTADVPSEATALYIPSYDGGAGETGTISIKTQDSLPELDSMTFKLTYDPSNALNFDADPIVFDDTTVFQGSVFSQATDNGAGELSVVVIFDSAETITAPYPEVTCDDHSTANGGTQNECEQDDGCTCNTGVCEEPSAIVAAYPNTHPTLFKINLEIDAGVAN